MCVRACIYFACLFLSGCVGSQKPELIKPTSS